MIRGILFDRSGTLIRKKRQDFHAGHERIIGLCDNPRGATADSLDTVGECLHRELPAGDPLVEFPASRFQRLLVDLTGLQPRCPPETLEAAFEEAAFEYETELGVREALEEARRRGLLVGVVTNSAFSARVLAGQMERCGLGRDLGFIISSADYGVRKPHPLLFEIALRRLGLPAADVLFVGDDFHSDVAGAKAVEMPAVWYNPTGTSPAATVIPDWTVRFWGDLGRVLE